MNNLPPEQLLSFDAIMVRPRTPPPAVSSASDTSAAGGSNDPTATVSATAPGLNVEGAPDDLKGSSSIGRSDDAPSEQQQQKQQTGHVLSTCTGAKASAGGEVRAGAGVTSVAAETTATNASGGASEGGGGGGMTITVSQAGGMVRVTRSLVLHPRSLEAVARLTYTGMSPSFHVDAVEDMRLCGMAKG